MLANIKNILWGPPSAVIIMLFGLYYTCCIARRGGFGKKQIKNAVKCYCKSGNGGISPLASLATALGGAVGVGSITGVGLALSVGGAGSMLWFWLCGLLCVGIKYAEVVSASSSCVKNGDITVGGAMYSLKGRGHKFGAMFFAVAGIAASFGTGNMTQASAVGDIMQSNGIPRAVTGLFLAVVVGFAVFGGQKRIAGVSRVLVPAAAVIYLTMAAYILILNGSALPSAFADIFSSAFGAKQAAGGALGFTFANAVSVGITRSVFSSEAGMGTSPMVHASAENTDIASRGIMGGVEIVADIFVFSGITALALLCGGTDDVCYLFSKTLGTVGRLALPVLTVIFAYSAIIAWCYYAESCIVFLFEDRADVAMTVYRFLSVVLVFAGTMALSSAMWDVADILNSFMMMPNLFDLFIRRKEILKCIGTK